MHILVIGGGGREHALAWKLAQSPRVTRISVAPGNAGTADHDRIQNVAIAATDIPALVDFAQREHCALTVVGPEAPLVAGVVDAFEAAGLACFGPRQSAAQLRGPRPLVKPSLLDTGSRRQPMQPSRKSHPQRTTSARTVRPSWSKPMALLPAKG